MTKEEVGRNSLFARLSCQMSVDGTGLSQASEREFLAKYFVSDLITVMGTVINGTDLHFTLAVGGHGQWK